MTSCAAVITDIQLESRDARGSRWRIALDRTPFTPGATGRIEAVSRTGARLEIPVLAVVEQLGDLWHIVEKPLAAGTDVLARVDADPLPPAAPRA